MFDGFSRVYTEGQDDVAEEQERTLPILHEQDVTTVERVDPTQHFTEPPPRYTEATLIKALEEHGIGRPSTYAATISTIVDRGYVVVKERRLRPEPVGEIVNDLLVENFGNLVDLEFTARMEEDLDEVASGKRAWVPLVRAFYTPFAKTVALKQKELRPADIGLATTEVCSLGHPMVIRAGRYGEYLACSEFPEHKETRPLTPAAGPDGASAEGDQAPALPGVGEPCPKCGASDGGTLVAKRGRFGPFVGCARYPDCDYIKKDGPPPPDPLPFAVTCPKCNQGNLTPRRARRTGSLFWGCSRYPKCDFTTSHEPLGALHDTDDGPVAAKGGDKGGEKAEGTGFCLKCGATIELPTDGVPLVGRKLAGGPPDPEALARPGRGGRRGAARGGAASGGNGSTRPRTSSTRGSTSRTRRAVAGTGTEPAAGA